jgi:hypothetical protein
MNGPARGRLSAGKNTVPPGTQPAKDIHYATSKPVIKFPWDQFDGSECLFGVKSDYDESFYTTTIDKSHPNYHARMSLADKKAQEIEKRFLDTPPRATTSSAPPSSSASADKAPPASSSSSGTGKEQSGMNVAPSAPSSSGQKKKNKKKKKKKKRTDVAPSLESSTQFGPGENRNDTAPAASSSFIPAKGKGGK